MSNTVYANKVIEAKAKDLLTTAVNTRSLMAVDNSLAQSEGMTKTVNVYTYTGAVEKLADGAKNSTRGSIAYVGTDYTVQRAQQVFDYLDSDFMKDNSIVDNMLKGANQVMVNQMTSDFITEAKKATLGQTFAILRTKAVFSLLFLTLGKPLSVRTQIIRLLKWDRLFIMDRQALSAVFLLLLLKLLLLKLLL